MVGGGEQEAGPRAGGGGWQQGAGAKGGEMGSKGRIAITSRPFLVLEVSTGRNIGFNVARKPRF